MSLADRIAATRFDIRGGELVIGGAGVAEIVDTYDTPLFVYDRAVIDRAWTSLRGALPDRVDILYSIKANPNRAILRTFIERGAGLEVASLGELRQAVDAGCAPSKIVFAGPGKKDEELRAVAEFGGGEIHVESANEARRLSSICDAANKTVDAAIRVNPSADAQGGAMRMGGKSAPFGVDEDQLDAVADILEASPQVRLSGVHLFAGTQILQLDVVEAQYRKCLEIAETLAIRLGRSLNTVDFGGGLGIPYFETEAELDLVRYERMVGKLVSNLPDRWFRGTKLLVEPGRFLVGEAGVYLVRVVDVKTSRGVHYAVTDGGMNHHLAASGNLGQVVRRNFPLAVANRMGTSPAGPCTLVGPLCTALDVLGRDVALPEVKVGDLIAVFQSGAYARASSPLGFLSHDAPAEVMVDDGVIRPIRRRGTYDDWTRDLV